MSSAPDLHEIMPFATNYIVEIGDGRHKQFVICQATQVIEGDDQFGGLTLDEIAEYISRNLLRAAPLPGRPLKTAEFRSGPAR